MARRKKDDDPTMEELAEAIAGKWDVKKLLGERARGAGRISRLDEATRQHFERRLGVDLGGVRLVTGKLAEDTTRAHGADALTIGGTGMILMGRSPERSMATSAGRALLAHELTHVAQDTGGLHAARSHPGSRPLATEDHEVEAEAAEHVETRGEAPPAPEPLSPREIRERVTERVAELLDEHARLEAMRNGAGSGW
ncbi:MAG TPA: DUF4157 domain-containing protein [Kofleriaceae bacterium]|nr:DUF4157 domain-containing protein [Kofleriaceae bacterium]